MLRLVLLLAFVARARPTYFTMSDVRLNLPNDKANYLPINHPLITLYGANERKLSGGVIDHLRYALELKHRPHLLQVFHPTGDIMFTEAFFNNTNVRNITFGATVEDMAGGKKSTTIQITVSGRRVPLDCDDIAEDLCFWQAASYQIFENTQPTVIGSLNSPYLAEMCPRHKLNYTLLEGGNQFELVRPPSDSNKSWAIRSLKTLERDVVRSVHPFGRKSTDAGEYRNLSVQCTVENLQGVIRRIPKSIPVKILDEDDNPPQPQTSDVVRIGMSSFEVAKGDVIHHKDLMFVDRDSPPVNQYRYGISGDMLNILDVNCTTFEDDRENELQTVIHCKLIFIKDMRSLRLPYAVTLEINDTTLLPGFGNSSMKLPIEFHYVPPRLARTAPPENHQPLLLYPTKNLTIARTAAPYARVTQPKRSKMQGKSSFRILSDSSGAFNVTRTEGIVYVEDITLLRSSTQPIWISIQWLNNSTKEVDEITVHPQLGSTINCKSMGENRSDWNYCAYYKNKKKCKNTCGLGTGRAWDFERPYNEAEMCKWRGSAVPGNHTTTLYSTCTPDILTCPDGTCDSLEELDEYICPQDCATREYIAFPLLVNPRTGKGFYSGEGVCACNTPLYCYCDFVENTQPSPTSTMKFHGKHDENDTILQPNVSGRIANEMPKCGTTCILGVTGSAVFLVLIFGGVMFCWRLGRVNKGVREKLTSDASELQVPLSDYVGRVPPPDTTLHFNFNMTTTLMTNRTLQEPDSKWEFPRTQLQIEQTLGEGEFGRVLRARALNISGQQGYTTVAVKTLKDDAGERELADLLSEYQLLKEVSHPNVIRLLGASTLPGGPVYLIIEFAEHGSLRNYLRRCRSLHTGATNLVPESYDEPQTFQVTPKEIISFAWQIANGMLYLSDIKLVHRDLAARNVLLATGKICKISDFGLTRDVYEDDAYFKRSKGRVPVKWMAPESLADHVYTNKSDVWSFGILLWELVTLGASPYPGIAVQSLFHLLKTGYRMERPANCSVALYRVMRNCWHLDPEKRPGFSNLSIKFEKMLSDQVQYLDLTGNAVNNRGYFCEDVQESEESSDSFDEKTNTTEEINYMNRSMEQEKCGDTAKIAEEGNKLLTTPINIKSNVGYETPVKIQNNVTTPSNEFPHYGYTDMSAGSK